MATNQNIGLKLAENEQLFGDRWKRKGGPPPSSSADTAQDKTIIADAGVLYICHSAGWGPGGENWLSVALSPF